MRRVLRVALAWAVLPLLAVGCKSDINSPATLSAPTGVTVTLISLTSVRVDWAANPAREQVRSYNVLRNGVKVGESTTPSFIDYGLIELQTYQYTVSANGSGTTVSTPSTVTPQSTFTLLDLTGPRVLSSVPTSGATAVAIAAPITITFSEPLSPATVNTSSVSLRVTATDLPVNGLVAYTPGGAVASFTPAAPLTSSTGYTVRVTTAVKDVSGNQLLTAYSAPFTTAAPIDNTPPTIISIFPPNGGQDVPTSAAINITFSEDIDPSSLTAVSASLRTTVSSTPVTATVSYVAGSRIATLTPGAPLANNTAYTVSLSSGVRDLAGNALAAFTSGFVTAPPVDNNPPTVTGVVPADGTTNVPVSTTVRVTFSEGMNAASITAATVTLSRTSDGTPVSAAVAFDAVNNRATLTPSSSLTLGTGYTVTVTTGARDLAGNALAGPFTARFTTIPPDLTPPTVQSTVPANNAVNVDPNAAISATFNEPMNAATMTAAAFTLRATGTGLAVSGSVTFNAATNTISFLPDDRLSGSTAYTATVTTAARDLTGNALATNVSFGFTTSVVIDNVAPTVLQVTPANNAVDVDIGATISVVFSEALNAGTVNSNTVLLRVSATGARVSGNVQFSPQSNLAQFVPTTPLTYSTAYIVELTAGVRDVAGNSLVPASTQFTTKAPPFTITSVSPLNRSTNASATAPVSVTFSDPINPSTINASTFFVRNRNTAALVNGAVSYNAANKTATFTPAAPYENSNGYVVTVTPNVTDAIGRSLGNQFESCFTPGPGTGAAVSMTGFWSGDTACSEIHWHIRLLQTGNTLSLATPVAAPAPQNNCTTTAGDCQLSALTVAGQIALGGVGVVPVTAVTGTVNGTAVTFTITTANGLTFTFNGAFATATGSPNAWLIGAISGATLSSVGISFEMQRP